MLFALLCISVGLHYTGQWIVNVSESHVHHAASADSHRAEHGMPPRFLFQVLESITDCPPHADKRATAVLLHEVPAISNLTRHVDANVTRSDHVNSVDSHHADPPWHRCISVSYTHLTLPTILLV